MIFKKAILWFLVLTCAGAIFILSNQPATDSDKVSQSVTEKIINISPKINKLPPEKKQPIVKQFNETVRKFAHFFLYTLLGIIALLLLNCYSFSFRKAWLFTLFICLLYAISDEVHQLFVPGRGAQVRDVLIDFSGVLIGSSIIALIHKRRNRKKNNIG